jgi:polyribonucleotide nucleotidyltransferase
MNNIEIEIRGKKLTLETGKIAKQADGAVIAQYGDTVVLATAVADKILKEGLDFFPLTVDYQEKAYAAGKIPGGFFKREGRPTEKEILTSRLIDRPIRPLFPKGFYYETQGIVSVLSYGDENIADILGIISISAALTISDIPFNASVGAVRIGRIAGSFVINPDLREVEECDLNLVVAGTQDAVVMVEGEALEISEPDLLEALDIAHQEIKRICVVQNELLLLAGKEKRSVVEPVMDEGLKDSIKEISLEKIKAAITISDKLMRQKSLDEILKEVIEKLNTPEKDITMDIASVFRDIEKELVRGMILNENIRVDGRFPDEIRRIVKDIHVTL